MNDDEFAFFNRQLAAMLGEGIPLEGALRRLSADMRRGALRDELERLEGDLAKGTPLAEALAARRLPSLYQRLVSVGAKTNDLPGVLTLLADYYQHQHQLWTRLQGLLVYPAIVLVAAFLVAVAFCFGWSRLLRTSWAESLWQAWGGPQVPAMSQPSLALLAHPWIVPAALGLLCLVLLSVVGCPGLRRAVRWRLPAFREASLSHTASMIWLLLKGGVPWPETVRLVEQVAASAGARREVAAWGRNLASGMTRFAQVAAGGRVFPPLFVWLVSSAGEDLASGFQAAAEVYRGRAERRSEILLYAALPVMILMLGTVVLTQAWVMLNGLLALMQLLVK